ncbi:MAG: hypothetical protein MUE41_01400 [Gemmatimonadaceae bacterium]|nr:hypothetical protein [Gemmatimonadaceae bacterium]
MIIEPVVRAHVEDAAFHWDRWRRAAWHPAYSAADRAEMRARADASMDGVRIAGPDALPLVRDALDRATGAGEVFVATLIALELGDEGMLADIVARSGTPAEAAAMADGLRCAHGIASQRTARAWQESSRPVARRAALVADVGRRGRASLPHARFASKDAHPLVRARAWRAEGELAPRTAPPSAGADSHAAADQDPDERAGVVVRAALQRSAAPSLADRDLLVALDRHDLARWIVLAGILSSPAEAAAHASAWLGHPVLEWHAPLLLAANGHAVHLDLLLEWLEVPQLNPVAGYALQHMLGVDAIDASLWDADERDGDLAPSPDEDPDRFGPFDELPPWRVAATRAWCHAHRPPPRCRVLAGQELGRDSAVVVHDAASMFQRGQLAYRSALLTGEPVYAMP